MSGVHSFLAASGAGEWVHCAGNPLMASVYPEADTQGTMEGEASHWVVSEVLASYMPNESLIQSSSLLGAEAPNSIIITEEMIECADVMIDDVLSVCQEHGALQLMHIEERMEIPRIHQLNGGTPDCWIYLPTLNLLVLWDYKFGHLDIAADSWQNKNYIAGILDLLNLVDTEVNVTMKIVQPRSYNADGPVKEHHCNASELRADFNLLESQAILATTSEPGVQSGPHCRYCSARHACPAARQSASASVDYAMSAIPNELTDEGLSFELALLERGMKAIELRYAGLKADAISRLNREGANISGYSIEMGQGNRRFNRPVEEVAPVGDLIGIPLLTDPKLITPAQFDQKLVAVNKQRRADGVEPIDKSVLDSYIERPTTSMKLVPSDKTLAVRTFRKL